MDFLRLPLSALIGFLLYSEQIDVFTAIGAALISPATCSTSSAGRGSPRSQRLKTSRHRPVCSASGRRPCSERHQARAAADRNAGTRGKPWPERNTACTSSTNSEMPTIMVTIDVSLPAIPGSVMSPKPSSSLSSR